jgi:hypothetical protein
MVDMPGQTGGVGQTPSPFSRGSLELGLARGLEMLAAPTLDILADLRIPDPADVRRVPKPLRACTIQPPAKVLAFKKRPPPHAGGVHSVPPPQPAQSPWAGTLSQCRVASGFIGFVHDEECMV